MSAMLTLPRVPADGVVNEQQLTDSGKRKLGASRGAGHLCRNNVGARRHARGGWAPGWAPPVEGASGGPW